MCLGPAIIVRKGNPFCTRGIGKILQQRSDSNRRDGDYTSERLVSCRLRRPSDGIPLSGE